jgi:hypothetical protein
MNWFERLFSVDEMRVSALVICLIAVVASCLISVFLLGSINDNLLSLAEACVYTVGGVTAVNGVKSFIGKNTTAEPDIPVTSSDGFEDSETPPKI